MMKALQTAPALLLMSCSQRKTIELACARAWDLYDGRLFQVLKRLFRETGRPAGLDILIVSAKYGVIRESRRIAAYDTRLTAIKGESIPAWAKQLRRLTRYQDYRQVHVNLGAAYRTALPDLMQFFQAAAVSFAAGGIGKRNAATRQWVLGLLGSAVNGGTVRRSCPPVSR
jgi:uncharacterized protein DUF6884